MWQSEACGTKHVAVGGTHVQRSAHAKRRKATQSYAKRRKETQGNARQRKATQGNAPDTWTTEPSTLSKRASVRPTGLGRWGERVANTPIFAPSSRGGCTCGRTVPVAPSKHACARCRAAEATARGERTMVRWADSVSTFGRIDLLPF